MLQALRLPAPDAPSGPALDDILTTMLDAFVRGSGAVRAAVALFGPEDEVPGLRARGDGGPWPRGEALFAMLRPEAPGFEPAPGADAGVWFGRPPDAGLAGEAVLAVAPLGIDGPEGGGVRGVFAAELVPSPEAARIVADAAAVAGRAVAMLGVLSAERAVHACEMVALRERVSAGFADIFGPRGCPGLEGVRTEIERAARECGPVWVWGEAGTGKAGLARLIHDLSARAAGPFATARPADAAAVFGTTGNGPSRAGAVEDAAGGTLYLADAAELAASGHRGGDMAERLVRLAVEGGFSRIGSEALRRTNARLILGSTVSPGELAREVPALSLILRPKGDPLRVIRVPPLRERPGDVPILVQRAVTVLAGRSGTRPRLTPRALKALAAYPWPGNDAEVRTLAAEALLSGGGERIDVGDLPARIFSLGPQAVVAPRADGVAGGNQGHDPAGNAPGTLWEVERARMVEALSRHGWVKARAARELGLTPRQLGWRMKRHGLARGAGG